MQTVPIPKYRPPKPEGMKQRVEEIASNHNHHLPIKGFRTSISPMVIGSVLRLMYVEARLVRDGYIRRVDMCIAFNVSIEASQLSIRNYASMNPDMIYYDRNRRVWSRKSDDPEYLAKHSLFKTNAAVFLDAIDEITKGLEVYQTKGVDLGMDRQGLKTRIQEIARRKKLKEDTTTEE